MSKQRTIVHLDLDSFFVSVERLKHPELCGKPVLVGSDSDRGVVASCSYEARHFGVRSAMPMRTAKQLCPDAIILRGDSGAYMKKSDEVTGSSASACRSLRRPAWTSSTWTSPAWRSSSAR